MSVGWQEELRQRLVDRNTRESAYSSIIEQCESGLEEHEERALANLLLRFSDRRLAQQTRLLKERNQSLLRAVGTSRNAPSGSTGPSVAGGSGEECVSGVSVLTDMVADSGMA